MHFKTGESASRKRESVETLSASPGTIADTFEILIRHGGPLEKYPAKLHAQRVARTLGAKDGLIYLPGTPTVYLEDSDQPRPFRQRRYFYYLSGVDEADCHLTYDIGDDRMTLYIPIPSPHDIVYNGRGITVDKAYEKYDVDVIRESKTLEDDTCRWMSKRKGKMYILHPSQKALPEDDNKDRVDSTKLQDAIDACRAIKDEHEIKLIRRANEITANAHRRVLENIAKFDNEAQVEATFLDVCVSEDAKQQAYGIIAASGENGAVLHYIKNDEPFADRQLMVLDAGCEWQNYASDVTRTFPINGKFTKEAKNIYDLVAKMQEACISRVQPGRRYFDLHLLAHKIAVEGLLELGIFHNGSVNEILKAGTSLAFFPHGLGHHMGLEVHDVSAVPINSQTTPEHLRPYDSSICRAPCKFSSPGLKEGMVVTVEPGIYFNQFALTNFFLKSPVHSKFINTEVLNSYIHVGGVRIEDDILVTAKSYENLTIAPKGREMLDIINQANSSRVVKPTTSGTRSHSQKLKKLCDEFHREQHSSFCFIPSQPKVPPPPPPPRTRRLSEAHLRQAQAMAKVPPGSLQSNRGSCPYLSSKYGVMVQRRAKSPEEGHCIFCDHIVAKTPPVPSLFQHYAEWRAKNILNGQQSGSSSTAMTSAGDLKLQPNDYTENIRHHVPQIPEKLPKLPPKPWAYQNMNVYAGPSPSTMGPHNICHVLNSCPSHCSETTESTSPRDKQIHRSKSLILPMRTSRPPFATCLE